MAETREFSNDKYKQYYQIAKGETEVDLFSFNSAYEILPDLDNFEEIKNANGKKLLASLRFIEPQFVYYRKDESSFLEDPINFSMRLIPGSDLERALSTYREIQSVNNELYGHYSVSLYLLKFLIQRNDMLVKKNKKLMQMYSDVVDQLTEIQKQKELTNVRVSELELPLSKKDGVLTLTDEEKKIDEAIVKIPEELPPSDEVTER